ncbi:response regulator transcription factor [Duganella callida]|uniref:Response regulator transcription factor n=1 Tax=Duganella callida TaxID=2561932 RepID=A0A4Y9SGX4_9BURK|nr:response regulator transcription factor [Duganella callida]TFW20629.1 response regulator transcription factor [Duganella callida]
MNAFHPRPIRILLADDHYLMREGVRLMLDTAPDMQLVASVGDGAAAIDAFKQTIPDVTLMDLRMAGGDGLSAIAAIRRYASFAKVVVLSTYNGDALVKQARKVGASAYLLKSMLSENMLAVIRLVHSGQQSWPSELQPSAASVKDDLTPRECSIMHLVARGGSNREIAHELGIGEETVKTYMRSILPKLGANDRAHAVAICMRRGYLDLADLP